MLSPDLLLAKTSSELTPCVVQLMFHTNVVFVWKLNGTTQGVSSELVFANALGPFFERALGSLLAKTSFELTPCMVQLMFHTNVVCSPLLWIALPCYALLCTTLLCSALLCTAMISRGFEFSCS